MNDVIIYTNKLGGVAICMPSGIIPIEEVQAKDVPPGVLSYIVSLDTLPKSDNDFLDAWVQTNGVVTVNLSKAKELTKERLRFEREPLLAAQDVLFQRALENNTPTDGIVAEKQRLRDITLLADAAETLAGLRALKAAN
jgi:hypothetical protein